MITDSQNKKNFALRLLKQELSRRNFWEFCLYYDKEFFIKRTFLKDVAISFQQIAEGKINSLSVSMPPRAGKSYITSLFCAWTLGNNPTESIMRNTCTSSLYLKFSYDVRNILRTEKYREIFSTATLSMDKQNLNGWNVNGARQVSYFGAGVGGTIIGFGASLLAITDDLYKGLEDAISDNQNERIHQWKEATHDSRIERKCSKIDIGTRWSVNDVIGRNYENKRYDLSIVIPALNSQGKSFCEDVLTTEQYNEIRDRINPDIWLAEYQQEPVDLKGKLFTDIKKMSLDEFNQLDKNAIEGSLAYIDVSDQGADYTAMAIGVLIKKEVFIVDYLYSRANTDVTIPLCADKLTKWKVNFCRVESNSMGAMFSRELMKHTKTKILQVNNTTNKITRIIMQSATILNNFTFIDDKTPEQKQFVENLISFSKEGKSKHDDAPDCSAGLSMFFRSMFPKIFY